MRKLNLIRGPIVVALGGNAISPAGEEGNIPQQFTHTRESARPLVDLLEDGWKLIITHGNGPQVGHVLRRVELALGEAYPLPLDICVADTQGGMGYMIAQCVSNELRARGIDRRASALVTTVVVDEHDPAFNNPTKPVGKSYPQARAEELQRTFGWRMVRNGDGTFRRVVPSPRPIEVVEIELIRSLAAAGEVLVAGGGGGVAVTRNGRGELHGIEAVIDKDRTSALIAQQIDAQVLLIATCVDRVALDYDKPTAQPLDRMTVQEARAHREAGHFPDGSMGPKIEAAITFLESSSRGDAEAIICNLDDIRAALRGASGTRITRT